jgi:hypothetical protein
MGIKWAQTDNFANVKDPDPSYELTMDNLLKIIAIYMRLRANIPVIIMGETGRQSFDIFNREKLK